MKARSLGSLCSLLLVWLCRLGASPLRHPEPRPHVTRGVVHLVVRDVVDTPLLTPRVVGARFSSAQLGSRDAPQAPVASPQATSSPFTLGVRRDVHGALALQDEAHAGRPRWRVYDAVAPPALSRTER